MGENQVTTTPSMYKGEPVTHWGVPMFEPNDVTRMLDRAYALGYTVGVQDPDSHIGKKAPRCADSREAWAKVLEHAMEVDDDFTVYFYKTGEHRHWMFFAPTGENQPDDGWMNDSCGCMAMDAIWDAVQ